MPDEVIENDGFSLVSNVPINFLLLISSIHDSINPKSSFSKMTETISQKSFLHFYEQLSNYLQRSKKLIRTFDNIMV